MLQKKEYQQHTKTNVTKQEITTTNRQKLMLQKKEYQQQQDTNNTDKN